MQETQRKGTFSNDSEDAKTWFQMVTTLKRKKKISIKFRGLKPLLEEVNLTITVKLRISDQRVTTRIVAIKQLKIDRLFS